MNNTKFSIREKVAAEFETALKAAGMQRSTGDDEYKPKYWRGQVNDLLSQSVFLLYAVSDNFEVLAADDHSVLREVYLYGKLFTRNGFSDAEYQDLAEAIENECEKRQIEINFTSETVDTQIDVDSPIYYCSFEAAMLTLITGGQNNG